LAKSSCECSPLLEEHEKIEKKKKKKHWVVLMVPGVLGIEQYGKVGMAWNRPW